MKKNAPKRRSARPGQPEFESRLRAYSVLGGAMLATTASAQIVNFTSFAGNGSLTLPSDGGFSDSFSLSMGALTPQFRFYGYRAPFSRYLKFGAGSNTGLNLNFVVTSSFAMLANLPAMAAVNGGVFTTLSRTFAYHFGSSTGIQRGGNFSPIGANAAVSGYLGFKMINGSNSNEYYGWLRFRVTNDGAGELSSVELIPRNGTTDIYGAFNSQPFGAIAAGEFTAIPEPASVAAGLALFALGAAGVREHRRRRSLSRAGTMPSETAKDVA